MRLARLHQEVRVASRTKNVRHTSQQTLETLIHKETRAILDGIGFLGPYTIEIEGIGGEPEPGLNERQGRVRRSADHLRTCGYFD